MGDFTTDCLLSIVKNHKQFDYNSISEENTRLLNVAIQELRQRFATKQVYFAGMRQDKYIDTNRKIKENEKEIIVDGDTVIFQIIEEFGDSIQDLRIRVDGLASPEKAQEMYKLIGEHCSDTLKKFQFGYLSYAFFPNISKPFKNVEFVKFDGDVYKLDNNQYSFSEIFPVLRRFELEKFTTGNLSIIDLVFPFLEHFGVSFLNYDSKIDSLIRSIIQKNPQIKGITLGYICARMITFVHDELPQLKSLEIIEPIDFNLYNEIHFRNVENFTIKSRSPVPNKINFNHKLLFFETTVNPYDNSFLDVIKQNQQLQGLKLIAESGISKNAMQELISANLNITKLSIINNGETTGDNTLELIESCKQLTDFHRSFATISSGVYKFYQEFEADFENEWSINIINEANRPFEIYASKKSKVEVSNEQKLDPQFSFILHNVLKTVMDNLLTQ